MLKDKLRGGESCVGAWVLGRSAENAAGLAAAGLDFVVIDGHGAVADALAQMGAIKATACAGLVRVPINDPSRTRRLIDGGAAGIMVPDVSSAAEARAAVAACDGGARVLLAVQVETAAGLDGIEEICAVDGVDLIFMAVRDADIRAGSGFARAEQIVLRSGKALGSTAADGKAASGMLARGYALVAAGSDQALLGSAATSMLAEARMRTALRDSAAPTRQLRDDWTATTSIRRMRRFWMAWCVAVLLLGAAVVGFGILFSISEGWWIGYKIGGRILAGLAALWAIYDAHRMAVHGTLALQEVLAQNLATMVAAELERLKAATSERRHSLAAKGAGFGTELGDDERIGLELPTCRFDHEDVRTLLGNPTEQALGAVLEAIEEYNSLLYASRDRVLSQGELARRIDDVFDSLNRAMASVVVGPGIGSRKTPSMTH